MSMPRDEPGNSAHHVAAPLVEFKLLEGGDLPLNVFRMFR